MASRRVRSSTGLRRKADAPPCMARSRSFGKSWPVRMITGSAAHFRARDACTLNPSICGMCRSRTTQSGRRVSMDFKNSARGAECLHTQAGGTHQAHECFTDRFFVVNDGDERTSFGHKGATVAQHRESALLDLRLLYFRLVYFRLV